MICELTFSDFVGYLTKVVITLITKNKIYSTSDNFAGTQNSKTKKQTSANEYDSKRTNVQHSR